MVALLVALLLFLVLALAPIWDYSKHWGYTPSGAVLVLVVLIMIFLM